ncbi:MAG: sensor histidine kinase [Burkholderiales bacterium]
MPTERSLHTRITVAFALLAVVVCGFFTIVVYVSFEIIEHNLFSGHLGAEIEWLADGMENGRAVEVPPGRRFFTEATAPEDLRALPPGYHDLERGLSALHVFVHERGDQRFILVSEERDFEQQESLLYLCLGIGCVAGLVISIWLGRLTSGRVIAPVTALAHAVQQREEKLPSVTAPDEIGTLARAFAARTTELRQFLVRERLFTADISHELRTPLTVILGAAEVIGLHAKDQRGLVTAAERIRRTAAEMSERVSAFLLLSRAPETLDAPRIALNPIIERELERCQPLLAGKEVTLHADAPTQVFVHARPELAATAIGNLIRNACQYTERGDVRVCLTADCVMVEDSGPGLPDSVRSHLFERFVRGSEENVPGLGLGLAIVERVTEHLNWKLRFEDRRSGGSCFILNFPPA